MLALERTALAVVCLSLTACQGDLAFLDAQGPAARRIADGWLVFLLTTLVPACLTIALLMFALWFRRADRSHQPSRREERRNLGFVLLGGLALPSIVLSVLMVTTFRLGRDLSQPPAQTALTIDVVGHMFWWEVRYPDHGIVTANEIHMPAGVPVRFRVTSADVIHSFWIPKLHGKLDMVPGTLSQVWMQADDAGTYRGQCAEFCGAQHALMAFQLSALPQAEFDDWLNARKRAAHSDPSDELAKRGRDVYFEARCAHCHTIRGVTPAGPTKAIGPDLTHLASRQTLGALTVPNNRGYLGGWILDPQAMKPGSRMPPTNLSAQDLNALLHYLESLL